MRVSCTCLKHAHVLVCLCVRTPTLVPSVNMHLAQSCAVAASIRNGTVHSGAYLTIALSIVIKFILTGYRK